MKDNKPYYAGRQIRNVFDLWVVRNINDNKEHSIPYDKKSDAEKKADELNKDFQND